MNDATQRLLEQYTSALQDYLAGGGEGALLRAYEVGRSAIAHDLNVLEMVAMHQEALVTVLLGMFAAEGSAQLTKAAADFLTESLAPFELAQRSSQEGKVLLRHLNEVLEQQVTERTEELRRERDFAESLITERQRVGAWLRSLINTTQDAVISIDRQGRIVLFNPTAERIFGYTQAEVQGQPIALLMPEPYSSEHDGYIARYERTGEPRAIGRIRTVAARRKNGEVFPIEVSVTEVKTDDEIRYGAFIRDISEKVRLQEQLIERERLAAIGATAATFAHEVGNPLNSMYMAAQLLERRFARQGESADDKLTAPLRSLVSEIKRLNLLLDEFRSLARRQKLTLQPTALARVVAEVLSTETLHYSTCGIRVEQEVSPDLPLIDADSEKLKQVLLNLCKNAAEAMPQGGTLTVRADNSGGQVRLEVSDTGTGIPAGVDIFEPFITTKPQGTGLGLTIVRQIVSAHRGMLTYHSIPGQGTTFTLMLPVSQPEIGR
ncbi:MAG: PAS domain S-box protein [Deltaproteobacteria bacterium]|nr:PAS domain S-box protein [Deltaproteobacteria bacterium]